MVFQNILLQFEAFAVEDQSICMYDRVDIYGGPSETANKLATYCGFNLPPPSKSSGQTLFVYFISDHSITENGFQFSWNSIPYGIPGGSEQCSSVYYKSVLSMCQNISSIAIKSDSLSLSAVYFYLFITSNICITLLDI